MTSEYELQPSYPSISYYSGIAQGYEQNGIPLKGLRDALNYCQEEVSERYAHSTRLRSKPTTAPPRRKKPKDFER